jgi:hypothetical protein
MPTRCEEVANSLPAILDGSVGADQSIIGHVEQCLCCQAELARYRKMLRVLHQLGCDDVALPAGALGDVLDCVGRAATRRVIRSALTGRRVAYVAGLVGAVVAAGGVVIATRARGTRTLQHVERS